MNAYERAVLESTVNLISRGYADGALIELQRLLLDSDKCVRFHTTVAPKIILGELADAFPEFSGFEASRYPQGDMVVTWEYGPDVDDVRRVLAVPEITTA